MPGYDQTGPAGQGHLTGRGLGICVDGVPRYGRGYGRGFGRGFGFGRFGRGFGFRKFGGFQRFLSVQDTRYDEISKSEEKSLLKSDLKELEAEIREIEKRLKELD